MLPSKLGDIDEAFLQRVCDENWEESSKLDFKRELPKQSDSGKKEFAKDVCAMANANGGDLIYGIEEKKDAVNSLKPISFEEHSPSETKERLIQILSTRLEPQLRGVQFEKVSLEKGYVLLVRVPQSFDGPHCVLDGDNGVFKRTFMVRDHISTRTLSYEELRRSFDRNGMLLKMAQDFRKERLAKINNQKVWSPMSNGPYCVMHWIPISTGTLFNTNDFNSEKIYEFISMKLGERTDKLNLDGMSSRHPGKDEIIREEGKQKRHFWNAQIFRSGAVEIAFALTFSIEGLEGDKRKWLYPNDFIGDLCRAMDGFKRGMLSFNVTFPVVVGLSMLRVRDYNLFDIGNSSRASHNPVADRQHMILPEEWIENLQESENIEKVERSIFDTLWQSFGLPKCSCYDDNGKMNF